MAWGLSAQVATPYGQACPLCLQIEDLESMIAVALPFPKFTPYSTVKLCTGCAVAVAHAVIQTYGDIPTLLAIARGQREPNRISAAEPRDAATSEAAPPDRSDPARVGPLEEVQVPAPRSPVRKAMAKAKTP